MMSNNIYLYHPIQLMKHKTYTFCEIQNSCQIYTEDHKTTLNYLF